MKLFNSWQAALIVALFLLLPRLVQAQTCVNADLNHPETATLNWTDNSTGEAGFIVERKQDAGAFQVIAGSLAANTKTYVDPSVKRDLVPVTYTYRVKAFRADKSEIVSSNESCISFAPVTIETKLAEFEKRIKKLEDGRR